LQTLNVEKVFNFSPHHNFEKGYGVYKASNSTGTEDKEARF